MKKRFLSLFLAVCTSIPCILSLPACGDTTFNPIDYLSFSLLEDNTYAVTLKDEYRLWWDRENMPHGGEERHVLSNKTLEIPSTYEGKSVTQIADYGFSHCTLQYVTIPNTITYIGDSAFVGSEHFQAIDLPASLKVIAPQAFYDVCIPGDKLENRVKHVVIPASVEYIGDFAFDDDLSLYYKGTLEQFSTVKGMFRSDDGLTYSEYPASFSNEQALYFYTENTSDITPFINPEHSIQGIWRYNTQQQIESVDITYTQTVQNTSFVYTSSNVQLTDEGWQMLTSAHEQGMLEMLLPAEEVTLFTSSSNKEEYIAKCEAYDAQNLSGLTVTFQDGMMTLWKDGTQYSYPLPYLEVNNAIYYKQGYNYTLAYTISGNQIIENISTEYSGATHYYSKQA